MWRGHVQLLLRVFSFLGASYNMDYSHTQFPGRVSAGALPRCATHSQPLVAKGAVPLPRKMNSTETHSLSLYGAPSICQALKLTFGNI